MEENEVVKKSIFKKWWFWVIAVLIVVIFINCTNSNTSIKNTIDTDNKSINSLKFGDLLSFIENTDIETNTRYCIIKAKIRNSYDNKATINQNYFNIEEFIKNHNGNQYDEIQYWAVADMKDGNESKVISFTLNKDIINKIYNNTIVANQIGDYATDLWILSSLAN